MNQFKLLDSLFPTLPNRHSGEVVSLSVHVTVGDQSFGVISWKRKAWYVNASTNAYILHRSLCKELSENMGWFKTGPDAPFYPSQTLMRQAKKLLAIGVWNAYVLNHVSGDQYTEWLMQFPNPLVSAYLWQRPAFWWNAATSDLGSKPLDTDWREQCAKWNLPNKGSSLPQVA